jgi:chromosomal replication initiation ATPase DnaA
MKQDVFNQYADKVSKLFSISRDDLFSKSKKREIVDARQLLYYLCNIRYIGVSYIQKYMQENGYTIQHPSVINGIKRVSDKMKEDGDYVSVIKDIEKSVFI